MKTNLSAIALGLVLAYAAAPVMADDATVTQMGNDDFVVVNQNSSVSATVTVEQKTGNNNRIEHLYQTGGANSGNLTQDGYRNAATIDQVSHWNQSNTATLAQKGNDNVAALSQSSNDYSWVNLTQTGNSNEATLDQKSDGYSWATLTQTEGNGNKLWLYQSVAGNDAGNIKQTGYGNIASVNQHR